MSIGALPLSQEDFQKYALLPSPIVTTMLALKSWRSIESQGTSVPTQGRSGLAHSNQSHLNRKALLNNSKSRIPSPPNFFGRLVLVQHTRQCPPFVSPANFVELYQSALRPTFSKKKTDRISFSRRRKPQGCRLERFNRQGPKI